MFWNKRKQKEAEEDRKRGEREKCVSEFRNLPKYRITSTYNLIDNNYDYSIEQKSLFWLRASAYRTANRYEKIYSNKSKEECEIRMKKLLEIEEEEKNND